MENTDVNIAREYTEETLDISVCDCSQDSVIMIDPDKDEV